VKGPGSSVKVAAESGMFFSYKWSCSHIHTCNWTCFLLHNGTQWFFWLNRL